jgi:predicted transcriptional regulator
MSRITRGKIEIIHDILQLCANEPKKRTHIMYKANLTHEQLNDYVAPLLSNGLLAKRSSYEEPTDCNKPGGHAYYMTTEVGRQVLLDLANAVRHLSLLFSRPQAN